VSDLSPFAAPHFTDRVAAAQQLVESSDLTPELADADRELPISTLRSRRQAIGDRGAAEQLLHGEPDPGNVLSTRTGLLFALREGPPWPALDVVMRRPF
jgi:hypothetical protein